MTLRAIRRLSTATAVSMLAAAAGLGAGTAAAATEQIYTGEATVTVATYDYCDLSTGERRPVGQQTYTAPVTLVVGDPLSDGEGGVEQNPFHFMLQSDQQNATGAFSLASALVLTTPETARNVTLTYWSATYDTASGALQAQLIEDHTESAAAYNLVNVEQQLVPCNPQMGTIPMIAALREGARLAGTLDAAGAVLELNATSSDGLYDFHVTTDMTRTVD